MGLLSRLPSDQAALLQPVSLVRQPLAPLPSPISTPDRRPVPSAPAGMIGWGSVLSELVQAAFGPIDWHMEHKRYWRLDRFRTAVSEQRQAHASAPDAPVLGLLHWLIQGGLHGRNAAHGQAPGADRTTGAWDRVERALLRKEALIAQRQDAETGRLQLRLQQFDAAKSFLRRFGQAGLLPGVLTLDEHGAEREVTKRAWANQENWRRLQETRVFEAGDVALCEPGHPFLPEALLRSLKERVTGRGFRGFDDLGSDAKDTSDMPVSGESMKAWLVRTGRAKRGLPMAEARVLAKRLLGPEATSGNVEAKAKSLAATARPMKAKGIRGAAK